MILGKDINPEKQIYYIGALVIDELKKINGQEFNFFDVLSSLKKKDENITMNTYLLSLDWLYLIGIIKKEEDRMLKCF